MCNLKCYILIYTFLSVQNCEAIAQSHSGVSTFLNMKGMNPSTDVIFVNSNNGSNSFTELTPHLISTFQVAFVHDDRSLQNNNASFLQYYFQIVSIVVEKVWSPSTFNFTFSKINNITINNKIRWIFPARNHITLLPKLNLMDQLNYFQNSTLRELYQVKDLVVDQETQPAYISRSGKETLAKADRDRESMSYEILSYMQDLLNFTIQFHNVSFWVFSTTTTGKGMADSLRLKETDLALSNTAIWPSTEFRFLYITRIYKEIYVYYNPPSVGTSRFEWVVQPMVWIAYGVMAGIIFLLSLLFFSNWSLLKSLSWTVGILTERGLREPESRFTASARCFFFTSLAFGLLFYVSFSSILISVLSVSVEISGMKDLSQRGYIFGLWQDSALHYGFRNGIISKRSPLALAKSNYKTFLTEEEGASEVIAKEKFAFLSAQIFPLSYAKHMKEIEGCRKMRFFSIYGEKNWGSAFVLSSSAFVDQFNFARVLMLERGVRSKHLRVMENQIESAKEACKEMGKPPPNHAIQAEEVATILYIYAMGLFAASAIFVIEYWKKSQRDKNFVF